MTWQTDLDEAFAFMHAGDKMRQANNLVAAAQDAHAGTTTWRVILTAMRSESIDEYTIGRIIARMITDFDHGTIGGEQQ